MSLPSDSDDLEELPPTLVELLQPNERQKKGNSVKDVASWITRSESPWVDFYKVFQVSLQEDYPEAMLPPTFSAWFCPDSQFPPANPPRTLHPSADPNKCLDVRGANSANGTPVQIYDCNGTGAQNWVLQRGSTKVRVAGTNFCLDAGSTPGNGVGMKIWQCYDNLPAQQWYYTTDNRIALEGKGLCLDLTNGVTVDSNQVQTWQCTDGNSNQIWYW